MKILVDTNVILDVLCNRAEFVGDSSKILKLCEINQVEGYISVLSIPNIVYIMRKELNADKIKEILNKLYLIFGVIDLKSDDVNKAVNLDFNDFEDALQSVAAKRIKADYIITRNIKDYIKSPVSAIKPSELLERL